jgi:DNA repair protein RadC
MKIKNMTEDQRPIEKLLKEGVESLTKEELLAIIIHSGTKNKSALDLAYDIFSDIKNEAKILNLSIKDLTKFSGIKKSKAAIIKASFELSRRALSWKYEKLSMDNPKNAYNFINPLLKGLNYEVIYCLYLDNKLNLLKYILLNKGSFNSANLSVRSICYEAMNLNASSIILVHNHPSGDVLPSEVDIETTLDLKVGLGTLGISLIDHLVIGDNNYYSMSDNGII